MPPPRRYQGPEVASDYSSGIDSQGCNFTLTRHERLMLRVLMEANGRTVTRDHLLNCVSGIGSDAGDRNVDFVINRLRRLTTFLIEKFGPHVVPAEIMADLSPDLAAHI